MRRNFAVWRVNSQHFIGKSCGLLPPCPPAPVPSVPSQALDPTELKSEGLLLSLEDQLSALTLSELQNSEPSATVCLNGESFKVDLFEDTRESTKVTSSPLFWPTELASPHICPRGYSPLMAELELFDFSWSNSPSSLKF